MDQKTRCENITELFSEKYSELYNSVSYETEQLATITNNNIKDISIYCMNERTCNDSDKSVHTHYVTHDQVQCCVTTTPRNFQDLLFTHRDEVHL